MFAFRTNYLMAEPLTTATVALTIGHPKSLRPESARSGLTAERWWTMASYDAAHLCEQGADLLIDNHSTGALVRLQDRGRVALGHRWVSMLRQMVTAFFVLALLLCLTRLVSIAQGPTPATSSFNQQWLDAVVSIETSESGQDPHPIGTGFLVRTEGHHILLVTAKHVVEPAVKSTATSGQRLGYRLTTGSGSSIVWEDDLVKGNGAWNFSTADIACRRVWWPGETHVMTIAAENFLTADSVAVGAPLLVLGFPLGLRSPDHPRPIARHGIVGRAEPDGLIADLFVFPGNSGGPVMYAPPIGLGGSTQFLTDEKLVGVVSSYIPYREPAVSPQTHQLRVMFEENTGLANIVPTDRLIELLQSDDVRKIDAEPCAPEATPITCEAPHRPAQQ